MSEIKVLAGSFAKRDPSMFHHIMNQGSFTLYNDGKLKSERISITQVDAIEIASEESVKRLGGTLGWGIAGAALFGPVGLLAGALLGGNQKRVAFVCTFKDGRNLMASTDQKTWMSIQAALLDVPKQLEIETKYQQRLEEKRLKKEQAKTSGKGLFSFFKR